MKIATGKGVRGMQIIWCEGMRGNITDWHRTILAKHASDVYARM